ncbi:MAG: hypothetical protein KDB27_18295 [Planctomycetales bacterium]|nr:hypothetical protein [Planctomycetales bacterium]
MALKKKTIELNDSDYDLLTEVESAGRDWRELLRKQLRILRQGDARRNMAQELIRRIKSLPKERDGITDSAVNHDKYLYGSSK